MGGTWGQLGAQKHKKNAAESLFSKRRVTVHQVYAAQNVHGPRAVHLQGSTWLEREMCLSCYGNYTFFANYDLHL